MLMRRPLRCLRGAAAFFLEHEVPQRERRGADFSDFGSPRHALQQAVVVANGNAEVRRLLVLRGVMQ